MDNIEEKIKLALVWPPQAVITESLFRHYNGLAETTGYLDHKSTLFKQNNIQVSIHDCAVKPYTAMNMAQIVYQSDIIGICVNLNNITEAITTAEFFKSVDENKKIILYGEGVCCNPEYFSRYSFFDYIIPSGQYELGLEVVLAECYKLNKILLHSLLQQGNSFSIKNKIVYLSKDVILPPEDWGIPQLNKLPLEEYINVGGGEAHITACKGCPFDCEFCNEKYVSTKGLRYRPINHIVDFLLQCKEHFKSAYLDASTFTYNKNWVIDLCKELIKHTDEIIPWKTCTRLDCIDEELINYMGKANCKRISIGVESIDFNIQNRNKKVIEFEKLIEFEKWCSKNGIKPRALFIIGLKGQSSDEIINTKKMFEEMNIETRFRVLQDFSFMSNREEITKEKLLDLNRWVVANPIENININFIRGLEFPVEKNTNFA